MCLSPRSAHEFVRDCEEVSDLRLDSGCIGRAVVDRPIRRSGSVCVSHRPAASTARSLDSVCTQYVSVNRVRTQLCTENSTYFISHLPPDLTRGLSVSAIINMCTHVHTCAFSSNLPWEYLLWTSKEAVKICGTIQTWGYYSVILWSLFPYIQYFIQF